MENPRSVLTRSAEYFTAAFKRRQIHFALTLRQGHVQQFMLRHDRLALEHMGDGVIQGLVFQFGDVRLTSALHRCREFLQRL